MFSSLAFAVDVKAEANEVSMYCEWVGEIRCDYQAALTATANFQSYAHDTTVNR